MGVEKDIDVMSSDTAASVFGSVDDAVDHDFGAIWNDPRIDCNRVVGGGDSSR